MSTEPYFSDGDVTLFHADCLDVLRGMPDCSVDSVCTDPPYGLEFMGREWDTFRTGDGFRRSRNEADAGRDGVFGRTTRTSPEYVAGPPFYRWCLEWSAECLRVLKPGGHMLAFGGTRTWHRLACAVEDAGFEIRDSVADLTGIDGPGLMWVYGSGFPKSLDVSKAIDRHLGAARPVVGSRKKLESYGPNEVYGSGPDHGGVQEITIAATAAAAAEGFGTALKPAWEPVVVGRKPLAGTVAQNVLEYGTGALNVDGCRVDPGAHVPGGGGLVGGAASRHEGWQRESHLSGEPTSAHDSGRWPPNVVLGEEAAAQLDRQSGVLASGANPARRGSDKFRDSYGEFTGQEQCTVQRGADSGGASRFFPVFRYEAKAPVHERPRLLDGTAHPTVKPLDLMRWLVRLVTPPDGLVLDPFAGSGTTGEACIVEGFRCVLIEQDKASVDLCRLRLSKPIQPVLDLGTGGAA